MTVAQFSMDQFVQLLLMVGLPSLIGTFSSGVLQLLKLSPDIPYVEQGRTVINRVILALICVVTQLIFGFIHHDPLSLAMAGQMLMNYFAATVAYSHYFKSTNPSVE